MLPIFKANYSFVVNRQEYDVREERRRELEFLEKVLCFDLILTIVKLLMLLIIIRIHHREGAKNII